MRNRNSVIFILGWGGFIWWLDKHVTIHDNFTGVILTIILTVVLFEFIVPAGMRMDEKEEREKQLKENENLNDDKKPNNDY